MEQGFRRARSEDVEAILGLMERYYAEDGYSFAREGARRSLATLLGDESLGAVWVAVAAEGTVGGYLAVTFGYSLEHGGRDAFVDELYLDVPLRGRGLGKQALRLAEELCRRRDVGAIHLEVERHRDAAFGLYRAAGFEDLGRRLLTKRLEAGG